MKLEMVLLPPGEFVMGDEEPTRVRIDRPFWVGRFEVTNEQYARFDPRHDSRYEQTLGITSTPGYALNGPKQPVVRVSGERATAFCAWLSEKTGQKFALPTEAQWEYACRAGTDTPFSYGTPEMDFSRWANMGDHSLEHFRDYSHGAREGWLPRDDRFDDAQMVSAPVGGYRPNAWGLCDMHGNVWEWTRSDYGPAGWKAARGGSWHDRPARCTSASRVGYPAWQGVYNVGFRVVCEP
jgi:formylglycine-generating enzyme required for sulfatase activity